MSQFRKPFFDRGYAIAEFVYPEVAIDRKEQAQTAGVYRLLGETIDLADHPFWHILEKSDRQWRDRDYSRNMP